MPLCENEYKVLNRMVMGPLREEVFDDSKNALHDILVKNEIVEGIDYLKEILKVTSCQLLQARCI